MNDSLELSITCRNWVEAMGVPLGAKMNGKVSNKEEVKWKAKSLEDTIFWPDLRYLRDAMTKPDVPETLKKYKFKRHVYMVTGVCIARGATLEQLSNEPTIEVHSGVEADGSAGGIPVGGGLGGGVTYEARQSQSAEQVSNFVFAYKLNEVTYRGFITREGTITHEPYVRGETSTGTAISSNLQATVGGFVVIELDEDKFDPGESADFEYLTSEDGAVHLIPKEFVVPE